MRTITICAWNRPHYLRVVLQSVITALHACPEFTRLLRIFIAIDPGGDEELQVRSVALQFSDYMRLNGLPFPEIIVWPEHLGVSESPRRILQHVFAVHRSEYNVHLEDDTVLSPDAFHLALWYWNMTKREDSETICLSLHSPSKETGDHDPSVVRYRAEFGVWGWCCTHFQWWLWFSHYWNYKLTLPRGWDWSISYMMDRNQLWAACPDLSRVRNIGRHGGVHATPEIYDAQMSGLIAAGTDEARRSDQFILNPEKPDRPVWEFGD